MPPLPPRATPALARIVLCILLAAGGRGPTGPALHAQEGEGDKEAPPTPEATEAAPARGAADEGVTVLWEVDGKAETLAVPEVIKRLGRFQQANAFDKLEKMAKLARATESKRLQANGAWCLTIIAARNGARPEELMVQLKEAVRLGYMNATAIESNDDLAVLHELPEFKTLLAELKKRQDEVMRKRFRALADGKLKGGLEKAAKAEADDPWGLGGLKSLSGEPFWQPGKPAVVVLAESHHDGFLKQMPVLDAALRRHAASLPARILFFQYDAADAGRVRQARDYAKQVLGQRAAAWSVAVAGREQQKQIVLDLRSRAPGSVDEGNYWPVTALLDARGVPIYSQTGVVLDWQASYILTAFADATGTPAGDGESAANGSAAADLPVKTPPEKAASDAAPPAGEAGKPPPKPRKPVPPPEDEDEDF